jgi:hypothetical protein
MGHPHDFAGMDNVWQHWFPEDPPARVAIPLTRLSRQGARIHIAFKLLAYDSDLSSRCDKIIRRNGTSSHTGRLLAVGKRDV